jgi:hypothetical protein
MNLPTVEEAFVANTQPFIAAVMAAAGAVRDLGKAVAEVQAEIDALHGKTVDIGVDAAGIQGIASAMSDLTGAAQADSDALAQWAASLSDASRLQAETTRLLEQTGGVYDTTARSVESLEGAYLQAAIANTEFNRAAIETSHDLNVAWEAADRMNSGLAGFILRLAPAAAESHNLAAGVSMIGATIAGASITAGVGRLGTMVHWIIAGGAELAAVLIPALVAFGAAALVAAQGAQMVEQHMSALYDATEATANMFHVTVGSALGLHSALQQAQNAANPIVFSVLGGVINILKGNFQDLASVGLQVMRVFQTFTARVVADFQSGFGTQIHGLLSGMVTDLVSFGQILGNVGHALLNFATDMPGLAHVLLAVADGISQVILWVSRLPGWLITTVMVFEEAWRWGGLLASVVLRIAEAFGALGTLGIPAIAAILTTFGTIVQSVALGFGLFLENIGKVVAALPVFAAETDAAGAAIAGFGGAVFDAVAAVPAWALGIGVVATAALGFLVYKIVTAKSAIQQLGDSMQHTVDTASGMKVFGDIASNIARLVPIQQQAAASADQLGKSAGNIGIAYGRNASAVTIAASGMRNAADSANTALRQQQQDMVNASQAVTYLSRAYGVSFIGALELGTQAGVQWDQGIGRMSVAADINRLKVLDLMAGYKAMGQSAGAVGMDMTALAIQSGLQASKIQQLTQAWQAYMGLLTGGTNSLATFEQGLQNIGTVASSSAGTLFEATGKMNASTQQFATSLQGFTGKSAQNWQNFNQVVTTGAEGFISWMQTAGAAGAVSGNQMAGAVKNVVGQLLPFAAHSAAARAELAGLAAQTGAVVPPTMKALEAWRKGGMSAAQMARFVQDATAKLSDMGQLAQKLGNVFQNDLAAMFDKAKIAASGLPGALSTLSTAMHTNSTSASVMQGDILNVAQRLLNLHTSLPTISALLNSMGINLSAAGVKALIASGQLQAAGNSAATAGGKMNGATGAARALAGALSSLHSVNLTVTTSYITEGAPGLGGTGFKNVPHFQAGTDAAARGLALVGEHGPELVWFHGGEKVTPAPETRQFLNSPAAARGAPGAAAAGGDVHLHATIPVTATLDGKAIFQAVQRESWRWSLRNSGAPGAWIPS